MRSSLSAKVSKLWKHGLMFDVPSIEEFAQISREETDKTDLEKAYQAQLAKNGFDHFIAFAMSDLEAPKVSPFYVASLPGGWDRYYHAEGYHKIDPTMTWALRERTPFLWSHCFQDAQHDRDLSKTQKALVSESTDAGLGNGIVIPLSNFHGSKSFVSVSGDNKDVGLSEKHAVHILSVYFSEGLKRISREAGTTPIIPEMTTRELEVLRFYAVGKSAWDISQILNVSEWTIRFHLKNIRAKYGVHSMVYAVALATQHEQIKV